MGEARAAFGKRREARALGVFYDVRDGALNGLLALLGQCFCERSLVVNLSGPFENVNGKRFMFTGRM